MILSNILITSRFFSPEWLLIIFSSSIVLLPLILAIKQRRMLSYSLKIILFYILVATICELISWSIILLPFRNHQNHWVNNILSIFEYSCFSYYLYYITNSIKLKQLIKIIGIVGFFLIIFITLNRIEKINIIDTLSSSIGIIILILFVLINFYEILNTDEHKDLLTYPVFWVSSGILIYFSGFFFVNLFSDILLFHKINLGDFWYHSIYYILLIIFRIFLAIGLWFSKTPIQSNLSSK